MKKNFLVTIILEPLSDEADVLNSKLKCKKMKCEVKIFLKVSIRYLTKKNSVPRVKIIFIYQDSRLKFVLFCQSAGS